MSKKRSASPIRKGMLEGQPVLFVKLTGGAEAIIDRDDADRVLNVSRTWHRNRRSADRYEYAACASPDRNGDLLLNRVVMGAIKGDVVGYCNGNRLDCRKGNLRFIRQSRARREGKIALPQ